MRVSTRAVDGGWGGGASVFIPGALGPGCKPGAQPTQERGASQRDSLASPATQGRAPGSRDREKAGATVRRGGVRLGPPPAPRSDSQGVPGLSCGSLLTYGIWRVDISEKSPSQAAACAGRAAPLSPGLGLCQDHSDRGSLREGDCALLGFFLFSPPLSSLPAHPQGQSSRYVPRIR